MKSSRGTTLIEALLYFGLFAMLAGGGLAAAYGVIVTAARSSERAAIAAEGDFLSAKIAWMLSDLDAASLSSPSVGASGTLEVRRSATAISLEMRGTDAMVTRSPSGPEILNGGGVRVGALRFARSDGHDGLEAVTASFTLSASSSGPVMSQDFAFTSYLLP